MLLTVAVGAAAEPFALEPGDLLFQDLDGSPLCEAIEKVTDGVDGADFSHVGMVTEVDDEILVIEAVSAGVVETPLEDFLARSKDDDGGSRVLVGRLDEEYRRFIPDAVAVARSFLGRPYDYPFEMGNDAFYCSELVYEAFRQAAGEPLFELAPMTFNDPDTGEPFPAWVDYYRERGVPIPEGEPGLNPGGMSRSPRLAIVHAYGRPAGWKAVPLGVMTYNIRYGTARDGESAWDLRKAALVEVIRSRMPDLLGTQEGLDFQVAFLAENLPEYEWFALGRDPDGAGEHMAVFYRRDRFRRIDGGHFWLSETPDRPGTLSWDSSLNRMATWVRLEDRDSGSELLFLNTHLDHRSAWAREQGAALIAARLTELAKDGIAIVVGDFNSAAEASPAYDALTGAGLADAWLSASEQAGPAGTCPGFVPGERPDVPRIDWILASPTLRVRRCEVLTDTHEGRYPSDHLPVYAVFEAQVSQPDSPQGNSEGPADQADADG